MPPSGLRRGVGPLREVHGSRRMVLRLPDVAQRPNDTRVRGAGPGASLSPRESMQGPASPAADC